MQGQEEMHLLKLPSSPYVIEYTEVSHLLSFRDQEQFLTGVLLTLPHFHHHLYWLFLSWL